MIKSFTEREIAKLMGVKVATVRQWRDKTLTTGTTYGPPAITLGRVVKYPAAGFRNWCRNMRRVDGLPVGG